MCVTLWYFVGIFSFGKPMCLFKKYQTEKTALVLCWENLGKIFKNKIFNSLGKPCEV